MKSTIQPVNLILFFCLVISSLCVHGQNTYSSEDELKKNALELFRESRYSEAVPLYSQLLSLYPGHVEYNFRYGACLIFTEADKQKALKYLEYGAKDAPQFPEINYFLGRAYHLNYRFSEAEKNYKKFLDNAPGKLLAVYPCSRDLEMAASGKKLTRSFSELKVVDKKLVNRSDFFRSYDLGDFGGRILVKPEEFMMSQDKKREDNSLIFYPDNAEQVYFSSYGDNPKNGKDIYVIKKLPTGGWDKPFILPGPINSPFDEDFPFLHPNGNILYFCSKGHNSMGGFDVFKSEFNERTQTWSQPVNMEFPLNSPGDELLFITDASGEKACFASSRSSFGEKIHIYQIQNTKENNSNILLAGNFLKPESVTGDLDATITVVSNQSQLRSGVFRPNSQSGDYLLNLPGPGSYRFTVEVEGLPAQSGVVEIPDMADSRPLRQQMELVTSNGSTRLLIRNLFDEEVSEEQLAAALEDYVKKTSLLEVNYIDSQPNENTADNITEESSDINQNAGSQTASQLSEEDLISLAKDGVEELKSEAKELKEEADYSYQFAGERTNESRQKKAEAEKLEASASSEVNPEIKAEMLAKAAALKKESETAARDALLAYNLALKIEDQAKSKEKEALENEQYAKELETAVNTKNEARAIELLEEQRKRIESQSSGDDEPDGIVNVLKKKRQSKLKEASEYRAKESQQKEEVLALMDEMDRMRSEASQTKDQNLQEQILSTVTDLELEKKALEEQVKSLGETAASLEKEAENLEQDIQLVQKISDSRSGDTQFALTEEEKDSIKTQVLEPTDPETQLSEHVSVDEEGANPETQNSTESQPSEMTASLEALYKNPASILDENGKVINYSEIYQSGLDTATVTKPQLLKAWQVSVQKELELLENGNSGEETSLAYQASLKQKVNELENDINVLESAQSSQTEINDPALTVETEENPFTEFPESNYAQESSTSFRSEVAVENAKKAGQLEAEYNNLNDEYYSALEQAEAAFDNETRSQLSLQAEKVKTELNEKLTKRDSLMSVATKAEFDDSDIKIRQALASETLTIEEKEQVSLNQTEANRLFSEASERRKQADGEILPEVKRARLKEVSELEMTALEKQLTAFNILESYGYKPEILTAETNTTGINQENSLPSESEELTSNSSSSETGGISDDESVITENVGDPLESDVLVPETTSLKLSPEQQRLIEVRNASYFRADSLSKVAQLHRSRQDSLRLVLESVSGKRKKEEIQTQIELAATEEDWHINESKSQRENGNKIQEDLLAMESTPAPGVENNSQEETQFQTDPLVQSLNQDVSSDPSLNETTSKALLEYTTFMEESESFGKKAVSDSLLSALKYNEASGYEDKLNSLMSEGRSEDDEEVVRTVELLTVTITAGDSLANSSRENRLISLQKAEEARNVLMPLGQDDQQLVISQYRNPGSSDSNNSGQITAQNRSEGNESETENSISENVSGGGTENRETSTGGLVENQNGSDNLNPENVNASTNVSVVNSSISQELVKKEIYPDLAVSSKLEKEYFVKSDEVVYNESTPIPIDAPMPEGLVFKVQVGAFRKPIPQDLFKEFVPVNGERTPQGFTRYTVGYFRKLETARVAKDVIRGNGYPDAFVVAFLNGKRISNQQAMQMVEGGGELISSNTTKNTINSSPLNNSLEDGGASSGRPGIGNSVNVESGIPAEEGVMEINQVNGILFTVQVGVFSKPVTNSPINDLQPLYREITPNGYYRYTSGIYPNAGRAQMAKTDLNNSGISDAFVTAYLNGRRISVAEASRMLESGEAVIATSGINTNVKGSSDNTNNIADVNSGIVGETDNPNEGEVNNRTSETVNQIGKTPESVKPVEVAGDVSSLNASEEVERVVVFPSGLLYVVQIGAFLDRVPNEEAAKFLKITDKGINHYRKRNGFTVYSAGQFSEYDKASALREELVNRFNLPDAFVVPYYNGYRIEIEKARDLELNNVND